MIRMSTVVLVMAAAVILSGCDRFGQKKDDRLARAGQEIMTESELEKQALLAKIERKYESPEAHYQLGKIYLADGLWDKAEWEFNVALGFNPVHRRAQAGVVKALIEGGNIPRSKLAVEMYMNQASSSAEASLRLGQAFQKELLDEYALACYQQAQGLAPNSPLLTRQIGYYYLSKGDKAMAQEYLKRSFQLDPYQPEVAGELGRLGVIVQIPRKTEKNTKKLDKIIKKSDAER